MFGYLQNLFQALDIHSMLGAILRVLAVLLCLTVHETCHGLLWETLRLNPGIGCH